MKTIITIILTIIAVLAVQLGIDYNTIGHGLHPVISTMVAVLCLGCPLLWTYTEWIQDDDDEFENIVLERAHCSNCGHYNDLINGRCANVKC